MRQGWLGSLSVVIPPTQGRWSVERMRQGRPVACQSSSHRRKVGGVCSIHPGRKVTALELRSRHATSAHDLSDRLHRFDADELLVEPLVEE